MRGSRGQLAAEPFVYKIIIFVYKIVAYVYKMGYDGIKPSSERGEHYRNGNDVMERARKIE